MKEPSKADSTSNEAPPFLGSWRNVYIAVLLTLVLYIVVMEALTRVYA